MLSNALLILFLLVGVGRDLADRLCPQDVLFHVKVEEERQDGRYEDCLGHRLLHGEAAVVDVELQGGVGEDQDELQDLSPCHPPLPDEHPTVPEMGQF